MATKTKKFIKLKDIKMICDRFINDPGQTILLSANTQQRKSSFTYQCDEII